jgi:outer membrane protein OmpA-like peptidoglycan-associated protein
VFGSSSKLRGKWWLPCVLLALCARTARAEPTVDLQTLQPPAGRAVSFSVEEPAAAPHASWVFAAHASYAHGVLRRNGEAGEMYVATDQTQFELATAVALFERLELGLVVPVVVLRMADDVALPTVIEPSAGVGDLRLSAKLQLVKGQLPLALIALGTLPTGAAWFGEAGPTFVGGLVFAPRFGPVRLAARLVYRVREAVDTGAFVLDDELDATLAAAVALTPSLAALLELSARVGVLEGGLESPASPWELRGGVRIGIAEGLGLDVGMGTGLPPGRDGYGAPAVRVFSMLRYGQAPGRAGGAADPDPDRDGLAGAADRCPLDAEDPDGFADGDGCPDLDDDADGRPDAEDPCPSRPEDRDGYLDTDGCPEPDNDADSLLDGLDACPMEPEDPDHFEDQDGCPEPGPEPVTVTVTDTRILVSERVFFEFAQDVIRDVSYPVLERVAAAIQELPKPTRVRVEGHSDAMGSEAHNTDLSHRRAAAVVRFLVGRGIAKERLEYRGLGSKISVASNATPEGQALNRRVEFVLIPGP